MSTPTRRKPSLWYGIAMLCLIAAVWLVVVSWPRVEVETVTRAPQISATAAPSVTTTETTAPAPTHTSTPSATTAAPPKVFPDPEGEPESMVIARGDQVIVEMKFGPRDLTYPTELTSQCGKVAWWDKPLAPRPGQLSQYIALVSGHMRCKGTIYSIDNLYLVKAGDHLTVNYPGGRSVVSVARTDAQQIDKAVLNADPSRWSNPDGAERQVTRVSTCDSRGEKRPDGHAAYNWWLLFDRIA